MKSNLQEDASPASSEKVKMKILKATIKDAEKIANLEIDSNYRWKESEEEELKDARRKLKLKTSKTYILQKNKKPIGYITFSFKKKCSSIDFLAISKQYQRKGNGAKLLRFVLNKIENKSKKIQIAVWEKNKRAIELYEQFGFKIRKVKKRHYPNGESKLIMEKLK